MNKSLTDYKILCLSHLRWETTLFQRPQQLMSHFDAMGICVTYVSQWSTRHCVKALLARRGEEFRGRSELQLTWHNLPYLPGVRRIPAIRSLNLRFFEMGARWALSKRPKQPLLLWIYYPVFFPLVERIRHEVLVYDCMDPFVSFRAEQNKKNIDKYEQDLIRRADVVFTGGPSLHEAKKGINPQTHCYPSGIDLPHFMKALDERILPPEDIASLPKPVFGYWGAVDERIDFGLLEALCRKHPDGSVVLLGPLVGMERPPLDLPNFHYLGEKDYSMLPAYLAAFDVCLLPFVVSPLTMSMSPTKTPEYLAGGRPVVSTALPDVARMWGDVVSIAETAQEFVAAVDRERHRPRPDPRLVEAARERALTWENIAASMRSNIETAIADKQKTR